MSEGRRKEGRRTREGSRADLLSYARPGRYNNWAWASGAIGLLRERVVITLFDFMHMPRHVTEGSKTCLMLQEKDWKLPDWRMRAIRRVRVHLTPNDTTSGSDRSASITLCSDCKLENATV